MNVQDWGAIGEVVSAVAVVVSIVYLSIQIRSNTRATKASASFDATHSWATLNEQSTNWPEGLLEALLRSMKESATWEDFDEITRMKLSLAHRALFQKLEGQYYLYVYGNLEKDIWKKRSSWAAGLIALPFYSAWWQEECELSIYSNAFVEAINAANEVHVRMIGANKDGA